VIANEWLVADAAERGDWAGVMRLGVRPDVASPQTRFLAFAAARVRRELLIDEPSATDLGLRWLWWRSADRRRNRPLLQQALASPRVLTRASRAGAATAAAADRSGRVRRRAAGLRAGAARAVGDGRPRASSEPDARPPDRPVQGLGRGVRRAGAGPVWRRAARRWRR
jgi:hypothetical protein